MGNRKELRDARRKVAEALESLAGIEALPRQIGQRVQWSNGVIWTRVGDDKWISDAMPEHPSPSAHVAKFHPTAIPAALEGYPEGNKNQ